jgi:uncharacterized protein (TIGR00661 family)
MSTIFYSVMGEGRGHAARARAMVERLGGRHRFVLYSFDQALAFLRALYAGREDVEVRETPGLRFHYTGERLNLTKTLAKGVQFRARLEEIVRRREAEIRRDRPELIVADFEPTVPRAAHRCGVPVLSLDHQHFIVAYDLSRLPWRLRTYAALMRPCVKAFGIGQQRTVVSAFYKPPLRCGYENVVQVGPLLRPYVRRKTPNCDGFVLCYLRKNTGTHVIKLLHELRRPFRVYGLGARPPLGQVEFLPIDEQCFVDDLAACDAVVAAAGNQLIGESLHFRKPVFAIPEAKHYEQRINASFLKLLGGGDWIAVNRLQQSHLEEFFNRLPQYRRTLEGSADAFDGTDEAANQIESLLAAGTTTRARNWPAGHTY